MIFLIAGASHTGKTWLAHQLIETYHYGYLSLDLLKMGWIRSGNTHLTPEDDEQLVCELWPMVREMIKTAIENGQNMIVEGIYIPFDWQKEFDLKYQLEIEYYCLVMSENYLYKHFQSVKKYANVIEKRHHDCYTLEEALKDNRRNLQLCKRYGLRYILIDESYPICLNEIKQAHQS